MKNQIIGRLQKNTQSINAILLIFAFSCFYFSYHSCSSSAEAANNSGKSESKEVDSSGSGCKGRFINPITDICWKCLLPISIGKFRKVKGSVPAKRDIDNPKSIICTCMRKLGDSKVKVPVPGITIGFWEPVRMVDVTRTRYCMVGLNGMMFGPEEKTKSGGYEKSRGKKKAHNSFYHLHYYIYPLIYWLELITDYFLCLEEGQFDIAYLSEFDPTWNDPKIQSLMTPESLLFGNPIAQAACIVDCASATVSTPSDSLFWCAGCWGNMYPWSGANADHIGGVQTSSLLTARVLAKFHRVGLAQTTSTSQNKHDGDICKKRFSPIIKKSQYKLQMVYPKSTSGKVGCWPIGMSDMIYSANKEYPSDGQDWSYVIWRKNNCCAF